MWRQISRLLLVSLGLCLLSPAATMLSSAYWSIVADTSTRNIIDLHARFPTNMRDTPAIARGTSTTNDKTYVSSEEHIALIDKRVSPPDYTLDLDLQNQPTATVPVHGGGGDAGYPRGTTLGPAAALPTSPVNQGGEFDYGPIEDDVCLEWEDDDDDADGVPAPAPAQTTALPDPNPGTDLPAEGECTTHGEWRCSGSTLMVCHYTGIDLMGWIKLADCATECSAGEWVGCK